MIPGKSFLCEICKERKDNFISGLSQSSLPCIYQYIFQVSSVFSSSFFFFFPLQIWNTSIFLLSATLVNIHTAKFQWYDQETTHLWDHTFKISQFLTACKLTRYQRSSLFQDHCPLCRDFLGGLSAGDSTLKILEAFNLFFFVFLVNGGGGGFFLTCEDLEMFDHLSPPPLALFFVLVVV